MAMGFYLGPTIQMADELKEARRKLFSLPSMDEESDLPSPSGAWLRVWNMLFNELVDQIPEEDHYVVGEGCPFCGAEDDELGDSPEAGNALLCDQCGSVLCHAPGMRLNFIPGTSDNCDECGHLLPVHGRGCTHPNRAVMHEVQGGWLFVGGKDKVFPYTVDELLVRIDRYVHDDICPDCERHTEQCD
jgi:hypothetical protein